MSPLFRQSVDGRTLDQKALADFRLWFCLRNEKGTLEPVIEGTAWMDKRAGESGYSEKLLEDVVKSRGLVGVERCLHCDRWIQVSERRLHYCPPMAEKLFAWSVFDKIDYALSLGKADLRLVEKLQKMLNDSLQKEAYRLWSEESGVWVFFYEKGLTDSGCFEKYRLYKWAGFLSLLRPAEVEWPPDSAELTRVNRFLKKYHRRDEDGQKKILFRLFGPGRSVDEVFKQAGKGLSLKDYEIIRDARKLGGKEAAEEMEKRGFEGFGRRSPMKVYEHPSSTFRANRFRWEREAEEFSSRESDPL